VGCDVVSGNWRGCHDDVSMGVTIRSGQTMVLHGMGLPEGLHVGL